MPNTDDYFELDKAETQWDYTVTGTVGTFWSLSGEIEYLQTNARLATAANSNEEKLTRQLYPVREILNFDDLDFDQLLQRDLDDHRVATQLIPYLFREVNQGLSFFPPVVAALLPFQNSQPKDGFPEEKNTEIFNEQGAHWQGVESENVYRFARLVTKTGDTAPYPLGRMSWNEGGGRLVILDGQHRAMAMLAISRTITGSWKGQGEKYKYFYEDRVWAEINRLSKKLHQSKEDWLDENITKFEFPVCVLRFKPSSSIVDQHDSARNLFVDVNKNARKPSESRIILLSDNDLLNIFTRDTLNEIKESKSNFPIAAIEYDHPAKGDKKELPRPSRWSAILNIEMLRDVVMRLVFGPSKCLDNMSKGFSGKLAWSEMNYFMRQTLELENWLPRQHITDDMKFDRDNITREHFPKDKKDVFVQKYKETWGDSIIYVLENFLPFKAHGLALQKLLQGWRTYEVHASLAKEALESGQGMYWTLKDHYDWSKSEEAEKLALDDTTRAWEATQAKRNDFDVLLSQEFLGKSSDEDVKKTKLIFDTYRTNACLVGLFTMLGTLSYFKNEKISTQELVKFCVSELNEALTARKGMLMDVFRRDLDNAFNWIDKMDRPDAVYFRYFWLEILNYRLNKKQELEALSSEQLSELLIDGRVHYCKYISETKLKRRKSEVSNSYWNTHKSEVEKECHDEAINTLNDGLEFWFKVNKAARDEWVKAYQKEHMTKLS